MQLEMTVITSTGGQMVLDGKLPGNKPSWNGTIYDELN